MRAWGRKGFRVSFALVTGACLVPVVSLTAQEEPERTLRFEVMSEGALPGGWSGGPPGTLFRDSVVVQGGRYAGRIGRTTDAGGDFSTLSLMLPVTFAGDSIELRGWLRTEAVDGFAGLWLRLDGDAGPVQFDNMQNRGLRGSTEWTQYNIKLPLDDRARRVVLGALLVGEGTVWADELELLVDGRPFAEAPVFEPAPTPVELDTEFDAGSGTDVTVVSPAQTRNLALLGRVWGFVKYHHPRVTKGEVNWDYELFRVLPDILAAVDPATASETIDAWLTDLGDPPPCNDACATVPPDLHLEPRLDWLRMDAALSPELRSRLQRIQGNRSTEEARYYVRHNPGVGNPDFSGEAAYQDMAVPDAGFRLLALYRFWNIIEYWFPYRDVIGADWDDVLVEFIPRLLAAEDGEGYRLILMELVARVHDTHANLWSDLDLRPPRGDAQLPVSVRFVEERAVVTGYRHPELGPASGLGVGDVLESLGGASIDSLVSVWRPRYAASNQPTRLRDMARTLTRGPPGPVRVRGRRADGPFEVTAERLLEDSLDLGAERTHDRPGDTFQMLTEDVAYLKLSSVVAADAADYVRRAREAEVLVIDIRNYPSEFVVFALGGHLVREPTDFARFTRGDPTNPGAFIMGPPVSLQPRQPHFDGKVVILVDETTQSQAEYTTMALRAAPGALVVGSTTAGADGNVSPIPLPGGARAMISGIGVFYPDGTPTQRIGIVPDLIVTPTISGIRAGRDEVLEAGVSYALGRPFRSGGR